MSAIKNFTLLTETRIVNNRPVSVSAILTHNIFTEVSFMQSMPLSDQLSKEMENAVIHKLYEEFFEAIPNIKATTMDKQDGSKMYVPEYDNDKKEWFIIKDEVKIYESEFKKENDKVETEHVPFEVVK